MQRYTSLNNLPEHQQCSMWKLLCVSTQCSCRDVIVVIYYVLLYIIYCKSTHSKLLLTSLINWRTVFWARHGKSSNISIIYWWAVITFSVVAATTLVTSVAVTGASTVSSSAAKCHSWCSPITFPIQRRIPIFRFRQSQSRPIFCTHLLKNKMPINNLKLMRCF